MAFIMTNDDTFEKEIFGDNDLKLVLFGASWCNPCQMFRPIVMEFSSENPDLKICGNDVDEAQKAAGYFGISSVPTLVVVKGAKEVDRYVGLRSKEELYDIVNSFK